MSDDTNSPGTHSAGEGVSDEEMVRQVGEQTSTDRQYQDFFERESDGTVTDVEAAKADADEAEGDTDKS